MGLTVLLWLSGKLTVHIRLASEITGIYHLRLLVLGLKVKHVLPHLAPREAPDC